MEYDELELDTLGEEKTALFVIISDTDATFNFVVPYTKAIQRWMVLPICRVSVTHGQNVRKY